MPSRNTINKLKYNNTDYHFSALSQDVLYDAGSQQSSLPNLNTIIGGINNAISALNNRVSTLEQNTPVPGTNPENPNHDNEYSYYIGSGSLQDADAYVDSVGNNVIFQWIYIFQVNNVQCKKVIWHVGNKVYIDALGGIVE